MPGGDWDVPSDSEIDFDLPVADLRTQQARQFGTQIYESLVAPDTLESVENQIRQLTKEIREIQAAPGFRMYHVAESEQEAEDLIRTSVNTWINEQNKEPDVEEIAAERKYRRNTLLTPAAKSIEVLQERIRILEQKRRDLERAVARTIDIIQPGLLDPRKKPKLDGVQSRIRVHEAYLRDFETAEVQQNIQGAINIVAGLEDMERESTLLEILSATEYHILCHRRMLDSLKKKKNDNVCASIFS